MIWWPLLFLLPAFADDPAVERYCYSSPQEMKTNFKKAQAILLPSDQATEDDNCLVIQMRPHRRELIQSYLRRLDPSVTVGFSSAEIRREACKLKVEKVKDFSSGKEQASVNAFGVNVQSETQKAQSTTTMQITTIQDFELSVDTESVSGKCRTITPIRYEITLSVKKMARPLVSNTGQLPATQETSSLQTTLQLTQGERIEIGALIKDLKDKNAEVSATPEASGSRETSQSTEKVFLSLD